MYVKVIVFMRWFEPLILLENTYQSQPCELREACVAFDASLEKWVTGVGEKQNSFLTVRVSVKCGRGAWKEKRGMRSVE